MKELEILEKQKKYFQSQQTRDIKFRKDALKKLFVELEKNQEELMQALYHDFGKSRTESYLTEIFVVKKEIKTMLKNLSKWSKIKKLNTSIVNFPSKGFIIPEPYGVCLIISPFNYPINLSLCPLVGAIAAGNCILLKLSSQTTNVNQVIKKMINHIFPEEHIYAMECDVEVTEKIIETGVNHIFFTGSVETGKKIMKMASKNLIPVILELGGKSPVIVDENTNFQIAARRIVWGKYLNAGQTCVAPDYVLVVKEKYEELITHLKNEILMFYENGKISKEYTQIINEKEFDRLINLIEEKNVLIGGKHDRNKRLIEPTIVKISSMKDKIMQNEIFGPILPVIPVDDIEQAVRIIQNGNQPLALYMFSNCKKNMRYVLDHTSSGSVLLNDTVMHLVEEKLPFGGVGNSGMGSYHGKASFDAFTHYKSMLNKLTKFDFSFRYPPYKIDFSKFLK